MHRGVGFEMVEMRKHRTAVDGDTMAALYLANLKLIGQLDWSPKPTVTRSTRASGAKV